MTPAEYRAALTTLGLSQQAAGRWLRVSPKTAQNYAKHGPSGPAAVAIGLALMLHEKSAFYTRQADQAIDPGLREERRHTSDALDAICYEAKITP